MYYGLLGRVRNELSTCMIVGTALLFTGCVDNDYDLSKDIDLNVTVGGKELTMPEGSIEEITLSQILDINDGSSIKAAAQGQYGLNEGDYVLVQDGSPTESSISIDAVTLRNVVGSRTETTLDPFIVVPGLPEIVVPTGDVTSEISISDDDVTTDLRTLSWVRTDISATLDLHYVSSDFTGEAIIKEGLKLTFDEHWVIEIADAATKAFAKMENGHTLVFTSDKNIGDVKNPLRLNITVKEINLSKLGAGQGLYKPGHFHLTSNVNVSGNVAIASHAIENGIAHLEFVSETKIPTARLLAVRGTVDPQININETSFKINDVPDVLSNGDNNLDIANPQLYFTVTNTSPVGVFINAMIKSVDTNGVERNVGIGSNYGTKAVKIEPSSTTKICICRDGSQITDGSTVVEVSNLSTLLTTVPDHIQLTQIEARADQSKEVEFTLSTASAPVKYSFNANYEAIIPLSFGDKLKLVYTTDERNWDEDLSDYNFNEVDVVITAVNTIPLNMMPEIEALDRNGNVLNTVTATITGEVNAGSIANPSTCTLTAKLKSTGNNIKDLDGVSLRFTASGDAATAGQPLNEKQSLTFPTVRVTVAGGVTINLND